MGDHVVVGGDGGAVVYVLFCFSALVHVLLLLLLKPYLEAGIAKNVRGLQSRIVVLPCGDKEL